MPRHSEKQPKTGNIDGNVEGKGIHEFLLRELPPGESKQAAYLTDVLLMAGARYDRYAEKRREWLNYTDRRKWLVKIVKLAEVLETDLSNLDVLSRDDLSLRLGPTEINTLIGSLRILSKETGFLIRRGLSRMVGPAS